MKPKIVAKNMPIIETSMVLSTPTIKILKYESVDSKDINDINTSYPAAALKKLKPLLIPRASILAMELEIIA